MMKQKIQFTTLLLLLVGYSFAQQKNEIIISGDNPEYEIPWEVKPKLSIPTENEKTESAFFILNQVRYELHVNPINNNATMYFTLHNKIHLNDDKAVESFNKIELPSSKLNKYIAVKARSIKPDGSSIELKDEDIKEQKDEDGKVYRMFAIDGLEKNSDIEYMYTIELPSYSSNRDILQYTIPSRKAIFELYSPKYIIYEAKGYNGIKVNMIDSNDSYNLLFAAAENIPAIEEEKYSYRSTYLKRIDFSLSLNKNNSAINKINTWDNLANKIGEVLLANSSELKLLSAYFDKQKEYKKLNAIEDKVVWIENHFKEEFKIVEDLDDKNASNFNYILKNKQSNEMGFGKIMLAAFIAENIEAKPVLTCNKSIFAFDKNMVSYRSTQDLLIYFPALKKFVMPSAVIYRFPIIPIAYEDTDGLLLTMSQEGRDIQISSDFIHTPSFDGNSSAHNTDAVVVINLEEQNARVNYKQTLLGQGAIAFRPYFIYGTKEQKDDVFKSLMTFGNEKEDIYDNIKVENIELIHAVKNTPLILSADITTNTLMEKAGVQYLFKIGKLIGRQAEMYQEKERQTDIDIDYMHHLVRKLIVKIPDGYEAKNLDKLKMNITSTGAAPLIGFSSNYKLDNGNIVVDIDEWYLTEQMPKADIEIFRKVINAAADFEKVVIGFEKKK